MLKGLSRLLTGSLREVDSVGRIGGEEFLVIAPETNQEGAVKLAERIRSTVEQTPVEYLQHRISVTVSVGFAVAEVCVPADYQDMVEAAAAALLHSKQTGRNRCDVRCLGEPPADSLREAAS